MRRFATLSFASALLAAPLLATSARAGELAVTPALTLTYGDPPGLCLLDPAASAVEAMLFQVAQSSMGDNKTVRLVQLLVDCAYLEAVTSGGAEPAALSGVGWALEMRDGAPYQSRDDRRAFVAARGGALRDNFDQAVALAAKQRDLDPAQVTETLFDDGDPEVFALGLTVGDAAGQVGVAFGVTMVQGYGVLPLSLRAPPDPAGLASQVAEVKALAHDLIARNDPAGEGRGGVGFGVPSWLVGGVIGLAVVLFMNYRRAKRQRARSAAQLDRPADTSPTDAPR